MIRLLILILLPLSSGCSAISHLDELSVLGGYARETNGQDRLVASTNAHYDKLLKAIADKSIDNYKDKASFVRAFGKPILTKNLSGACQVWLYRYAVLKKAKDKVYVYFDSKGHFVKWEKAPCPSFF